MKRLIIFFILVFQLTWVSYAGGDGDSNLSLNGGLSIFFESEASPGGKVLEAVIFSSLTAGIGYHFNLIPHIFSPGIYGDIHVSLVSLLSGNSNDSDVSEIRDKGFSFFQLGIRIYNQFGFGDFDIQPFAGLNLMAGNNNSMGLKLFGILVAYKSFGIEYSYQLPLLKGKHNLVNDLHRISLLYHLR